MRISLLLLIALAVHAGDGGAQPMGAMPAMSPAQMAEANAACESLASIPNPPMSVAACKSMLGMAATMERMRADPAAQRPGDDALSCDAIFAELVALGKNALPSPNERKVESIVADSTALANRQAAETTTFIAGTFALGAVMGALSPVMPNFVAAAIAMAWAGSAVALGTKQVAESAALQPRRSEAIIGTVEDFQRTMEANPRFMRLAELGMMRQCEPPPGALR